MKIQQHFPLTKQQEGLWFEYKVRPNSNHYNCYSHHEIKGVLDEKIFFQALKKLMETFDPFRLHFKEVNDNVFQIICDFPIEDILFFKDLSGLEAGEEERKNKAKAILIEESSRPYCLTNESPMRLIFIKLSSQLFYFGIAYHHISGDAFSTKIYYQFLTDFYNNRQNLAEKYQGIGIKDYFEVLKREEIYSDQEKSKSIAYWKEMLKGRELQVPLPQIPFPRMQRDSLEDIKIKKVIFHFDQETFAKMKGLYKKNNTTPFRFFSACFGGLLCRYWSYQKIIMGYPVSLRPSGFGNSPGFYVSMFPLRLDFEKDPSIEELTSQVTRQRCYDKKYQNIVFSELAPYLRLEEKNFDLNFNVSVGSTLLSYDFLLAELEVINLEVYVGDPISDLSLLADFNSADLKCELKYNPALFSENFIKVFSSHFKKFVKWSLENPNEKISGFYFLSQEESHQILVEWNNTKRDYSKDKKIHQLFEEQVKKSPGNTAVVFEDTSLTYGDLNEKSNKIAHFLRENGVKPDTLVAIACDRSLDMIIGILAILKAGGAYVPLDPSYPMERLSYMMGDTKAPVLLTHSSLIGKLPKTEAQIVLLDDTVLFKNYSLCNLVCTTQSNHLAYIIYTSGSTGNPKGVMIEHKSICGRLFWYQDYIPLSYKDRFLHQFSFSFDGAIVSLWWPLLNGATVIMPTSQGLRDIDYMISLIQRQKVTALHPTPSVMSLLCAHPHFQEATHVDKIMLAGEVFTQEIYQKIPQFNGRKIYNFYGPTESTIIATSYEVTGKELVTPSVPIGTPTANTQVYILDASLHPAPLGVVDELYIGGDGLARGYLNQPDLTSEKFIKNPFVSEDDQKAEKNLRLYRTGDLCRWLEDGNIEYMGRIDDQVKLRGFRIELGEIESALKQHPTIKEAIVILREDIPGDKRLVAYLISKKGCIDFENTRSFLKKKLPEYMIPSAFVELDSFPLTPNGKTDKKELPKPAYQTIKNYVGPRTENEQALTRIIGGFLKVEQVSINDNFFDLGIHSLMLLQLHSKIQKEFNKQFPMIELLNHSTITKLLNYLTNYSQNSVKIRGKERSDKRKHVNKA